MITALYCAVNMVRQMNVNLGVSSIAFIGAFGFYANAQTTDLSQPIVSAENFAEEKQGLVSVEAEHFYKQDNTTVRKWYRTGTEYSPPNIERDDDDNHSGTASNKIYLEILPDTRVSHSDKLIHEENFSNDPGKLAVLFYKVKINNPGRYYVWVRAHSTGTEDNGIHVGYNGSWPEHGQRMQWCEGKNKWTWESKQRTKEVHCGVPKKIYLDIVKAGIHDIQFSMREDGFEFDKFILTTNEDYVPEENEQ